MLFLGLCREAGIPVLDALRERSMRPASRPARTSSRSAATGRRAAKTLTPPRDRSLAGASDSTPVFSVTEADFEVLDEAEFSEVWQALGIVVGKLASRGEAREGHGGRPSRTHPQQRRKQKRVLGSEASDRGPKPKPSETSGAGS